MTSSRYRLGNQVVLVEGRHASALYDLYHGRIQRISSGLGELLAYEPERSRRQVPSAGDDTAGRLVAKLAARGFLEECHGNSAEDYAFDHVAPRFPPLRTLSFEVGPRTTRQDLERAGRLVLEAIDALCLASFAFLVQPRFELMDELERVALDALARTRYVLCEFWGADGAVVERLASGAVAAGNAGRIMVSKVRGPSGEFAGLPGDGSRLLWEWGSALSASAMICRPDYYHLLMNYSESRGCLHFDEAWRIFPDVSERDYHLGSIDGEQGITEAFDALVADEYWRFGKDRREKCRDCELRYACPNPLSMRSQKRGLGSAPGNCRYDLELGAW
jgi:hypothetical protein